jgi:hypothetical protein
MKMFESNPQKKSVKFKLSSKSYKDNRSGITKDLKEPTYKISILKAGALLLNACSDYTQLMLIYLFLRSASI